MKLADSETTIWQLAERITELRSALSEMHHASGAHCAACPGETSREQPHCPHAQRWCSGCKYPWPCGQATKFALPGAETHSCDRDEFSRVLCACGAMHSYCGVCGKQGEECGS